MWFSNLLVGMCSNLFVLCAAGGSVSYGLSVPPIANFVTWLPKVKSKDFPRKVYIPL